MYCKITLGNIEEHIVVKHFKMYLFGTLSITMLLPCSLSYVCNGSLQYKYSMKHSTYSKRKIQDIAISMGQNIHG